MNPLNGMKPEEIGPIVAQALQWNGPAIFETMREALTDANFHTEAAAMAKTWENPEQANAAPQLLEALKQMIEAATHHRADIAAALDKARAAIKTATTN
jgi:mono/diheme cytochrome c family protein